MSTTDPELAHKVHVYAGEAMHAALNETGGIAYTVKAVVDAILARYAVVELPEPDGIGDDLDPYGWSPEVGYIEVNTTFGIYLSSDIGNSNLEPSHARELAAALLAAANRAEAQ